MPGPKGKSQRICNSFILLSTAPPEDMLMAGKEQGFTWRAGEWKAIMVVIDGLKLETLGTTAK